MNDKEISEIRRRYRAEKSGISRIRGCYVNEKRTIISEFDQSLGLMSESEAEEVLTLLRMFLRLSANGKIPMQTASLSRVLYATISTRMPMQPRNPPLKVVVVAISSILTRQVIIWSLILPHLILAISIMPTIPSC